MVKMKSPLNPNPTYPDCSNLVKSEEIYFSDDGTYIIKQNGEKVYIEVYDWENL